MVIILLQIERWWPKQNALWCSKINASVNEYTSNLLILEKNCNLAWWWDPNKCYLLPSCVHRNQSYHTDSSHDFLLRRKHWPTSVGRSFTIQKTYPMYIKNLGRHSQRTPQELGSTISWIPPQNCIPSKLSQWKLSWIMTAFWGCKRNS